MKKSIKILITVIVLMFAVIGIDCAVGFTIGGRIRLTHILIIVTVSLVLTFLSILFINCKGYEKSGSYKETLILVTIGLVAVCCVMYTGLNRLSAGNETVVYDTYIESSNHYYRSIFMEIIFEDREGNMASAYDKNIIWFDDDSYPDEGAPITIREKQGGFGYPVYDIIAVNGRRER